MDELKLHFLRPWNGYDRGVRIPFPYPGVAEELVKQGVAEVVRPAPGPSDQTTAGGRPTPRTRR